jgi:endonuclease YncB( thermonuclease family)
MRIRIPIFFAMLFSSSLLVAQNVRISKIIDTNLFELDNGQKVTLYGLFVPERQDTNVGLSRIADIVFKWENEYLLDGNFSFDTLLRSSNGIVAVVMYKKNPLYKTDVAKRFLENGYAALLSHASKAYSEELSEYQDVARKDSLGIWKDGLVKSKHLEAPMFTEKQRRLVDVGMPLEKRHDNASSPIQMEPTRTIVSYSRPYLPLLVVGVAAFALAWDNFASVSDIETEIDLVTKQSAALPAGSSLKKEYEDAISRSENVRNRKTIVAIACIAAGLVTTVFSLKQVEVRTDFQSLSVGYNF